MTQLRWRTRSLLQTLHEETVTALTALGWITEPVNLGVTPVTVVDYQPLERDTPIKTNTVAVTIGDVPRDLDEELGAAEGGLRSVSFPVFIDAYMNDTPVSVAICDDLVEHFTDLSMQVKDSITQQYADGISLIIEDVAGPRRPPAASGGEAFRRNWRIVNLTAVLYFNT